MQNHYARTCLTWLIVAGSLATAFGQPSDTESWMLEAEAACDKIVDVDAGSLAFYRLQDLHVQAGNIEQARGLTKRIRNAELRVQAHIAVAKLAKTTTDKASSSLPQLGQATLFAKSRQSRSLLVDAFLDLANSPKLAIALVDQLPNPTVNDRIELCEAMAKRGYLMEALDYVPAGPKVDDFKLKMRIANAAAKAGRIQDTEYAVEQLSKHEKRRLDYYQQSVWLALAMALHEQQQVEVAQKYAARVTDKYLTRTKHRVLRRIAGKALVASVPGNGFQTIPHALAQASKDNNPEAANQAMLELVANIQAHPIKPTSGQFGPSNNEIRLNAALVDYVHVAKQYDEAGKREKGLAKLRVAEDAIVELVTQNSFIATMHFPKLLATQIAMNDIAGLKRITQQIPPELWVHHAKKVVNALLAAKDNDGAQVVARRALATQQPFGGYDESLSSVVNCFVESGHYQATLDLLQSTNENEMGADACESAAHAMLAAKQTQQLDSWIQQLPPTQRAHLCIGAAQALLTESQQSK